MKLLHRVFASVAALIALGSSAQARAPQARPALWSVSDADTTVYLFGTIHLLPDNYQWRTPKLDQAVGGSQQLVIETIVDDKDPTKLFQAMSSLAFSPGLPPLAQRVPPEKRAALTEAVRKSGFPPQAFDRMETWAVAFILLGNQFKDLGLKGTQGVEASLRSSFSGQGKPVTELESNLQQLTFFDKFPRDAKRLGSWRRESDRPFLQSRPVQLAGSARRADQAAQRQLDEVDCKPNDATGCADGRGRRRPSGRSGFGRRSAEARRIPRASPPVRPARIPCG